MSVFFASARTFAKSLFAFASLSLPLIPATIPKTINAGTKAKEAAKGLLIASFVFFGLFLSYSIYCFYKGKIYCGLAFAGVTALSFPFSIFLKKMPTRLKVLLRVLRIVFTIVGAAFALIYLFNR